MSSNLSHYAVCEKRTVTVWRDAKAFCSECGSSHAEMAAKGLNTAGPWDDYPYCQDRHYYELKETLLRCECCGLTKDEAKAKDDSRPKLMSYRPKHVTSGSLVEIQYLVEQPHLPILLSVSWLPQHGHTTVRLLPEDFPRHATKYAIAIEIPHGASSAIVIDRTGTSRSCEIPIEFQSSPQQRRRPALWKRLLGLS